MSSIERAVSTYILHIIHSPWTNHTLSNPAHAHLGDLRLASLKWLWRLAGSRMVVNQCSSQVWSSTAKI